MNNLPKISAIIPTCDRPQFLREAIDSIRAQTFQPIEIIVANNGKEPLPEGFFGEDVKIKNLEPYVGVSAARNSGAEAAKGDCLAFLDDDDKWGEDFLKNLAATMTRANADYIVADKWSFDGKSAPQFGTSYTHYAKGTQESLCGINPGLGGGNFLVKTKPFWAAGGFDEGVTMGEDQLLPCELAFQGYKIVGEPKARYYARKHHEPRLHYKYPRYCMQLYNKTKHQMTLQQKTLHILRTCQRVVKYEFRAIKRSIRNAG